MPVLENPLKTIEILIGRVKEFVVFSGFTIKKQKTKMLTKI